MGFDMASLSCRLWLRKKSSSEHSINTQVQKKKVMWYDWLTIFNTNRKWHLNNSNISSDLHGDYIYFYYVFTIPPLKRGFAGKKDWWPFSLNLIQLKRNCNPKVHKTHFYRFWHFFAILELKISLINLLFFSIDEKLWDYLCITKILLND